MRFVRWACSTVVWILALAGAAAIVHAHTVRYPERLPWVGNRPEVYARIPAIRSDAVFRFALVGDPEDGAAATIALLRTLKDRDVKFVLIAGDLVKYPTPQRYGYFLSLMEGLGWEAPTLCAIGNSDVSKAQPHLFEDHIGERVFRFEAGGCFFAFFDNAEGFIGEDQVRPIDALLARERSRFRHVFFVMHKPLFAFKGDETPVAEEAVRKGNAPILDVIRRHHVDYVLCGHLHGYLRVARDGTTHLVTGGGGGALQQDDVPHHLIEIQVGPGDEVRERLVAGSERRPALGVVCMDWHAKVLPWVKAHTPQSIGIEAVLLACAAGCVAWVRRSTRRG